MTRTDFNQIKEAFDKAGVPYAVMGKLSDYDRQSAPKHAEGALQLVVMNMAFVFNSRDEFEGCLEDDITDRPAWDGRVE